MPGQSSAPPSMRSPPAAPDRSHNRSRRLASRPRLVVTFPRQNKTGRPADPVDASMSLEMKWPGPREDPGGAGGLRFRSLSSWTGPRGNDLHHKVLWGVARAELGPNCDLCFVMLQSV